MRRLIIRGIIIVSCLGILLSHSHAEPQYSILAGDQNTGSYQFAQELSRLWDVPALTLEGSLIPVIEKDPNNRLQRLRNRQGTFAILPPQSAYQLLPQNLEIAVISSLWPNVLHVLTPHPDLTTLRLDPSSHYYIHENSDYFIATWNNQLSLQEHSPSQFHWFTLEESQEIFSKGEGTIILTAPYPLKALDQQLIPASYRLIPLNDTLHTLTLHQHSWLISRSLPGTVYRNTPSVNLLTSYPVLVGRADTSRALIQNVLKILFSQQELINPHPLFRFLNPQDNHLFKNEYHFHAVSKKFFQL